ncbi:inosine 5'-monophosphate dehydrogenase [Actinobacillus equuli]|nr:inosine 5'-monophosphate dehydrogenase [Actinobacillus equuli]
MTPKDRLVTVKENATRDEILELMHDRRVEKVLVVDDNFKLKGMITVKDFQKRNKNRMRVKMNSVVYVSVRLLVLALVMKSVLMR